MILVYKKSIFPANILRVVAVCVPFGASLWNSWLLSSGGQMPSNTSNLIRCTCLISPIAIAAGHLPRHHTARKMRVSYSLSFNSFCAVTSLLPLGESKIAMRLPEASEIATSSSTVSVVVFHYKSFLIWPFFSVYNYSAGFENKKLKKEVLTYPFAFCFQSADLVWHKFLSFLLFGNVSILARSEL